MKPQTVQRIVWTASITGVAIDLATLLVVTSAWAGLTGGAFVTVVATVLMIATLALQATFVIMQMLRNGQAMVPVGLLGPDGWSFVIISTAIPGVVWHNLAALALPFMRPVMPGFVTPLYICLLLFMGRLFQQRRVGLRG